LFLLTYPLLIDIRARRFNKDETQPEANVQTNYRPKGVNVWSNK